MVTSVQQGQRRGELTQLNPRLRLPHNARDNPNFCISANGAKIRLALYKSLWLWCPFKYHQL